MEENNAKNLSLHPRVFAIIAVAVLFVLLYVGTNHLAVAAPHFLNLSNFEKSIPFWPSTVFVYLTALVLAAAAILLINFRDLPRAVYGIIGIMVFCTVIFLAYPTAYPRPYLPASVNPFTREIYRLTVAVDTPRNCFPSMHVAICLFASFALARQNKNLGIIFGLWSCAIIISTLLLKQHYLADLAGGFIIAIIFYLIVFKIWRTNKK